MAIKSGLTAQSAQQLAKSAEQLRVNTPRLAELATSAKEKELAAAASVVSPGESVRVLPQAKNPVAEAQAKLEKAVTSNPLAEPQETAQTTLCTIATRVFTGIACAVTAITGLAIGVGCVLLGTALFLFPFTAGLSLSVAVVVIAALGMTLYVSASKEPALTSAKTMPMDLIEPLAAGRFRVAGVA